MGDFFIANEPQMSHMHRVFHIFLWRDKWQCCKWFLQLGFPGTGFSTGFHGGSSGSVANGFRNLNFQVTERELEDEFIVYGVSHRLFYYSSTIIVTLHYFESWL